MVYRYSVLSDPVLRAQYDKGEDVVAPPPPTPTYHYNSSEPLNADGTRNGWFFTDDGTKVEMKLDPATNTPARPPDQPAGGTEETGSAAHAEETMPHCCLPSPDDL